MVTQKKETGTYEDIVRAVKSGRYSPIYYLMGDESYYIDRISDYIVNTVLKEEEKDFNLNLLYGLETSVDQIINLAREYPMMSEHRVVLVREAQNLNFENERNAERFLLYLRRPQPTTILVFCHKHGVLDRRKKVASEIQKTGVLFESKKLYDNQLPGFVTSYLKRKGVAMEQDAVMMICDYVGSDLNHMAGELDKLVLALPANTMRIDSRFVESHVGISKDFNNFELLSAIIEGNIYKANRIVKVFNENPKVHPVSVSISVLFNFFSSLMEAYYAPVRTEDGIAEWLGVQRWQVTKNILPAMKRYSGIKVMQIIEKLRETDEKNKGIGGSKLSNEQLLGYLIYFIMH